MKMNHNDVYARKDLLVVHTNFTTCGRGWKLTPFSYELKLLLLPPPLSWPFFLNWPLLAKRSRAVVSKGSEGALASPEFGISEKRTSFCLYHYQPPQILKPNDLSEKRG